MSFRPPSKRLTLIGILLGLGLVVLGIASWPSSDEEAIAAKLQKLAEVVAIEGEENPVMRTARLRREFAELFEEDALVLIPELQRGARGRRELADLGARGPILYSTLTVDFAGVETIVDSGKKSARTKSLAKLSGTRGGEIRRDERKLRIEWKKEGGEWLMGEVRVEAAGREGESGL